MAWFVPAGTAFGARPAESRAYSGDEAVGSSTPAAGHWNPTRVSGSDSLSSEDRQLGRALVATGLENVSAARGQDGARVAYENRRFRHSASALGTLARASGGPTLAFERRLGLVAAALLDAGGDTVPARVAYPSDGGFPAPPSATPLRPTRRSVDLLIGPLFTYELGRILDPVLLRIELQPEVRHNPWPGGRLRAGVVIPVRNDFEPDSLHPDINRVRPGPVLIEQYAWSPGAALISGTAGLLGNNRYGLSFGIGRPVAGGHLLIDGQTDVSGFFAFNQGGVSYSTPSRWTGFAGVTYRPPRLDLGVRLRAAKFLHGDSGVELEVRRALGDLGVAMFLQRSRQSTVGGVRTVIPLPPPTRPSGGPIRVLPVERIAFEYREEASPVGRSLTNVASREDYLAGLNPPSLAANSDRYRGASQGRPWKGRQGSGSPVSLVGMTGFVNTPWCGVLGDREVEVGYNTYSRGASYQYRTRNRNDVYYMALGFVPRVEVGLRWSVFPGVKAFSDLVSESRLTDSDRMFSARLEVLPRRGHRPGLGVGIEDVRGTRRFHSTYAVLGVPLDFYHLQSRVSLGYAPRVFMASRRTLEGFFGALEASPWKHVAVAVEHDSEKWNGILGARLPWGLRARAAALDMKHASFGAGWYVAL